ncbi:MAG TPA: hypothetical protein VLC79_09230 [Cellvibrio sp.]|nr:hypothetical protein [Cellvibrio sp.]
MMLRTTLDHWTDVCQGLFGRDRASVDVHPLHACVIDGVPHYVHAPGLAQSDPDYFTRLTAYAARHGIRLKADRRAADESVRDCRRKKFLSLIFLAMSMPGAGAFADEGELSLNLIAPEYSQSVAAEEAQPVSRVGKLIEQAQDSILAQRIEQILLDHLDDVEQHPPGILDDIQELARYYAHYPVAAQLIQSIADSEWKLKYAPHTFQTNIKGSRMDIDSVEVFFDPRSGAKLKFYDKCAQQKPFCVASPADALLHELLHVQTITIDKNAFIGQGGLDPWSYPAEHERLTIMKENALYRAMTLVDKQPRPLRSEHNGRHVLVSCATCYE